MATVEEMLQALILRVEALEAANGTLRAQLEAARGGLDLTMRGQGRCRACGGANILHAETINDAGTVALSVTAAWTGRPLGTFEAYICVACGAVEWYVKDPGNIKSAKRVTPPAPAGDDGSPYR